MASSPPTTFATLGASLGLSEDRVLDALVVAIRTAGPGAGGRFVGPKHFVGDDWTSSVEIEEMRGFARSM